VEISGSASQSNSGRGGLAGPALAFAMSHSRVILAVANTLLKANNLYKLWSHDIAEYAVMLAVIPGLVGRFPFRKVQPKCVFPMDRPGR
jgi:hypothetical protein